MKQRFSILITLVFLGAVLTGNASETSPSKSIDSKEENVSGTKARDALKRIDFLVGSWEGEGWSLTRSGGRRQFWVKEFYKYRGNNDLLDMEGRFGEIGPERAMMPENEFGLGILFFDESKEEYKMWHYSSSGEFFEVKMNVDAAAQEMYYILEFRKGERGKFHLVVGSDGVWISKYEIELPDKTWLQVMEFRMRRTNENK